MPSNIGTVALQYASILQFNGRHRPRRTTGRHQRPLSVDADLSRTPLTNEVAVIFSNDRVFFFTENPVPADVHAAV